MNNSGMAVVPPGGGWRHAERLPDGSYHPFLASTEADLIKQVTQFRVDNGFPIGDVEIDVKSGSTPRPIPMMGDQRSLRERVTAWKANRQFGSLTLVDQETANKRAKQAALCSHNILDYADDCLACYSHTLQDLYAMRQGKSTPYDNKLGADSICGHDNKTAVWLDEKHLKHRVNYIEKLEKECPNCWLLKLDKPIPKEVA